MQYGRYEIRSELGRGGMGTLYVAYDPQFDREVALKVLHPGFLQDPAFRMRFDREARLIARLEHKAIVPVYDYGEDLGQPYLVMRLMKGGTLEDRLMQGRLPLDEINAIMQRMCGALELAHSQNIIHRDIKPKNILFDDAGEAYLADFGIARLASQTSTMTMSGTPAYMAPEQARGEPVDHQTDIYQLGMVLYQMLTGRLPFDADTPAAALFHHAYTPPPPAVTPEDDLPDALETVVQTALAKEKRHRYPSAGEFAAALDAVITQGTLPPDLTMPLPAADAPTVYEPLSPDAFAAYTPPPPQAPPPQTPPYQASPMAPSPGAAVPKAPEYAYVSPAAAPPVGKQTSRRGVYALAGAALVLVMTCLCAATAWRVFEFDLGRLLGGGLLAGLEPGAAPTFGRASLEPGSTPFTQRLTAGGNVDLFTALPNQCAGYVTSMPDFHLDWSGATAELHFAFTADRAGDDTVLVVYDPAGEYHCNDDADGLNPEVAVANPAGGGYDIWVGTYSEGDDVPGTLTISEQATLTERLNPERDPLFGADELSAGFSPDPFTTTLDAGGPVIVNRALAGEADAQFCAGFATSAPSFRLTWAGRAAQLRFFLSPLATPPTPL